MPKPKTPLIAVDCVVRDSRGRTLLIRRQNPPFKGQFALPGGFVDIGETVEATARRELMEETGVKVRKLALIGVYSDPKRDPRSHTCSVAFLAHIVGAKATAASDAAEAAWIKNPKRKKLAFDHHKIIGDALKLSRKK